MKNTRKFMAAVMALAMVSALSPMSAFAADTEIKPGTNGTPDPSSAGLNVKYNYTIPDPTFTVTIPAGVELSDSADTETAIKAKDIKNLEEKGKKIVVKLASASNDDDDDTTFHAKNGDSDATYTIKAGSNAVKVGDTVAEFKTNSTDEVSSELTFSKITLPANPVEGDYTETLTFGIAVEAVEEAVATPTLADAFENGAVTKIVATNDNDSVEYIIEGTFNGSNFENVTKSGSMTDVMKNVTITKNGDKIVASIECIVGTYGTITLTFDTTNNTYSVNATGSVPMAPTQFGSISVNGENVNVSAS